MADWDDVIAIGKVFCKHLYRCPSSSTMNDAKDKLFSSPAKMPKLKVLPPMNEAPEEHIYSRLLHVNMYLTDHVQGAVVIIEESPLLHIIILLMPGRH